MHSSYLLLSNSFSSCCRHDAVTLAVNVPAGSTPPTLVASKTLVLFNHLLHQQTPGQHATLDQVQLDACNRKPLHCRVEPSAQ